MKYIIIALFVASFSFSLSPYQRTHFSDYDSIFKKYSKRYFGVDQDWKIFKAQGIAESGLNPKAISWVHARGIMQLMPTTFSEIQSRNPEFTSIDNIEANIGAGIYYDRQLYKAWDSLNMPHKIKFTFGSYNAGRGTIMKAQDQCKSLKLSTKEWENIILVAAKVRGWRYTETLGYVEKILYFREQL